MDNQAQRIPPHNIDAEKSILGAMMISKKAAAAAGEKLTPGDFYFGAHAVIYETLTGLMNSGKPTDIVILSDSLEKAGKLEACGGYPYLADISTFVPTVANIDHYIKIVKGHSQLRQFIDLCGTSTQEAFEASEDSEKIIAACEQGIMKIMQGNVDTGFERVGDRVVGVVGEVEAAHLNGGRITGFPTKYPGIDNMTGGFYPGQVIVLAGDTGTGKTTLAMNIAQQAAMLNEGEPVIAYFSLEMQGTELIKRILAKLGNIRHDAIKFGRLFGNEWDNLISAADQLATPEIWINKEFVLTAVQIINMCRRLKILRHRLNLVVIDYLQLITYSGRASNEREQIDETTRLIKLMAEELQTPVLLLSQLKRPTTENKVNRRPRLADLRGSGGIENNADVVMFTYIKDNKDGTIEDIVDAEILIEKQRSGRVGPVEMKFDKPHLAFRDVDDWHEEPGR